MSSPLRADAPPQQQLEWYKTQYAQLETDLADFQASSKELEEQLEKDVEAAEKNERKLKEQVEKLNFEVEEWKTKHKQSKTEANTAQNALQKEITSMRDAVRSLQLKLRDIEVINDDYEQQARHTESSLEDLESKYNVAIERGVLLDGEIKVGEQEREKLRIETQRLRDEYGDLKVENEITLEQLRLSRVTVENLRSMRPSPLAVENLRARSPGSEASGITPISPTASTPPPRSDIGSDAPTPPSPPLSDEPRQDQKTPVPTRRKGPTTYDLRNQRPSLGGSRPVVSHTRGQSGTSSATTTSDARTNRAQSNRMRVHGRTAVAAENLPRSESLHQIRGLIGRMQKIEERVHNARSKLPSLNGTPRGSPRTGSAFGNYEIPSSVTVRRSSKRPSVSINSSAQPDDSANEPSEPAPPARRASHVKRLSYGLPRPSSVAANRSDLPDRPPSSALERPPSSAAASRPSSRLSVSSASQQQQHHRPGSRAGARTAELGYYPAATPSTESNANASIGAMITRPASSIGGSHYATTPRRTHRPSASISELRQRALDFSDAATAAAVTPTPSRRTTLERSGLPVFSGVPAPAPMGLPRRQSGGGSMQPPTLPAGKGLMRRPSERFGLVREEESGFGGDDGGGGKGGGGKGMGPPPSRKRMSDLGETY